jgi:type IV pilus assembly protein PilP
MRFATVFGVAVMAGTAQAQDVGMVDPFRSILDADPTAGSEHLVGVVLGQFELDQLRLVAVVTGVASPVAMLEDPHGQGHMVRVGTLVGRDGAVVKRIGKDTLILETVTRRSNLTVVRTPLNLTLQR